MRESTWWHGNSLIQMSLLGQVPLDPRKIAAASFGLSGKDVGEMQQEGTFVPIFQGALVFPFPAISILAFQALR